MMKTKKVRNNLLKSFSNVQSQMAGFWKRVRGQPAPYVDGGDEEVRRF